MESALEMLHIIIKINITIDEIRGVRGGGLNPEVDGEKFKELAGG